MNKTLQETVEQLLASKGITKDAENYAKAKEALGTYMESFDSGVQSLLEGDFSTNPPKVLSQEEFMKLAGVAQKDGASNTVGKGQKTPGLDEDGKEVKAVKDDKTVDPKGKDWSDKPAPAPETKDAVDKKAAAAQKAGAANTVGKGAKQVDLDNKGMLESAMKECILHDEYIEFVRSFKDGSQEVDTFVESVVSAFMESHGTVEKFEEAKAMLEGAEAVEELAGKVGDALKMAADKIAEGEAQVDEAKEEAKEVVDEVAAVVSPAEEGEVQE